MCRLERYKEVILLRGTSPSQKWFHFSFQPPREPLFDLIFLSLTASNQPASVYFHLENKFSAEEEVEGVVVAYIWELHVPVSNVNVPFTERLFTLLDCWKPNQTEKEAWLVCFATLTIESLSPPSSPPSLPPLWMQSFRSPPPLQDSKNDIPQKFPDKQPLYLHWVNSLRLLTKSWPPGAVK